MKATVQTSPNIALIKYWGKRDETLILPQNSSLSITLDAAVRTITTVEFDASLKKDEITLSGQRVEGVKRERVATWLDLVRKVQNVKEYARVSSENNFPTGAGIASSASGFSALAAAVNEALTLKLGAKELSILARQGSGSATRSVLGGFVEWQAGTQEDGTDSYAVQIAAAEHWPEIHDVIVIVQQTEKELSSRKGMKQTVETSALFKKRLPSVSARLEKMKTAILGKDFEALAAIMMEDSDSMHACMADTTPAINYLTPASEEIKTIVHTMQKDGIQVGYTFDAGPNAHLITMEKDVQAVQDRMQELAGVQEIITSSIGTGPKVLAERDALF